MEKLTHTPVQASTVRQTRETFTPEPVLNPILKKFPESNSSKMFPIIAVLVVVLLGVGTGYVAAKKGSSATNSTTAGTTVSSSKSVDTSTEAGINDEAAFPDTAEGVLVEGGIQGEGTHHLDRGMGANKDVYISSTVINLQNFVGKKVQVRGQTISGKKAGWLMDVGKIKVIQ